MQHECTQQRELERAGNVSVGEKCRTAFQLSPRALHEADAGEARQRVCACHQCGVSTERVEQAGGGRTRKQTYEAATRERLARALPALSQAVSSNLAKDMPT